MSDWLQTQRLAFRYWEPDSLPLATALWCDPEVMRHMAGPYTPEQAKARLDLEISHQQSLGFQYWPIFLRETGEFAGCAGLKPFHGQTEVLEVGVHIAKTFWSGRFGEEAARAVIDHAFRRLGVVALAAAHGPDNIASKALIERLGFVYTHDEPWGPWQRMHPFYRLERDRWSAADASEVHQS